ncbi:hypothetical protein ACS5PN_11920 [Roseateles sp. NT4]|uniref:hypothetical protein n=1 Tax=Roseateles sp. NT4 TaxID=3453715 RepID=UPI003EEC3E63
MIAHTVQLERLFDVHYQAGDGENAPCVIFSCVADSEHHSWVRLPGHPRLEVGDRVTVVLRRADNWHSLIGWKNHSNGEVVMLEAGSSAALAVVAAMACAAGVAWSIAQSSHTRLLLSIGTVAGVMATGVLAMNWWQNVRAARILQAA